MLQESISKCRKYLYPPFSHFFFFWGGLTFSGTTRKLKLQLHIEMRYTYGQVDLLHRLFGLFCQHSDFAKMTPLYFFKFWPCFKKIPQKILENIIDRIFCCDSLVLANFAKNDKNKQFSSTKMMQKFPIFNANCCGTSRSLLLSQKQAF